MTAPQADMVHHARGRLRSQPRWNAVRSILLRNSTFHHNEWGVSLPARTRCPRGTRSRTGTVQQEASRHRMMRVGTCTRPDTGSSQNLGTATPRCMLREVLPHPAWCILRHTGSLGSSPVVAILLVHIVYQQGRWSCWTPERRRNVPLRIVLAHSFPLGRTFQLGMPMGRMCLPDKRSLQHKAVPLWT